MEAEVEEAEEEEEVVVEAADMMIEEMTTIPEMMITPDLLDLTAIKMKIMAILGEMILLPKILVHGEMIRPITAVVLGVTILQRLNQPAPVDGVALVGKLYTIFF